MKNQITLPIPWFFCKKMLKLRRDLTETQKYSQNSKIGNFLEISTLFFWIFSTFTAHESKFSVLRAKTQEITLKLRQNFAETEKSCSNNVRIVHWDKIKKYRLSISF